MYFIYGRSSTYLTFDIYLGPNRRQNGQMDGRVRFGASSTPNLINSARSVTRRLAMSQAHEPWLLTPTFDPSTNLLTVTVDLSKSTIAAGFRQRVRTVLPALNLLCGEATRLTEGLWLQDRDGLQRRRGMQLGPRKIPTVQMQALWIRFHHAKRLAGASSQSCGSSGFSHSSIRHGSIFQFDFSKANQREFWSD